MVIFIMSEIEFYSFEGINPKEFNLKKFRLKYKTGFVNIICNPKVSKYIFKIPMF
jgi:hypothetical protein